MCGAGIWCSVHHRYRVLTCNQTWYTWITIMVLSLDASELASWWWGLWWYHKICVVGSTVWCIICDMWELDPWQQYWNHRCPLVCATSPDQFSICWVTFKCQYKTKLVQCCHNCLVPKFTGKWHGLVCLVATFCGGTGIFCCFIFSLKWSAFLSSGLYVKSASWSLQEPQICCQTTIPWMTTSGNTLLVLLCGKASH